MLLALFAMKYQMKYAKTWLLEFPNEAVSRSHIKNAKTNHEMFAGILLGTSVIQSLKRFQNEHARTSLDRFVSMYQRKNVVLFHSKNVMTRKLKTVRNNAQTAIGVKNVHLIRNHNLSTESLYTL
jgi:hypothetical protein